MNGHFGLYWIKTTFLHKYKKKWWQKEALMQKGCQQRRTESSFQAILNSMVNWVRTQYQNLPDGRLSARESGFRNAGNIFADGIQNPRLWDPGITITAQKVSEISLKSGVKNPGISDKD